MKKSPLKRSKIGLRRSQISVVGHSTTTEVKKRIQALLREIVMLRDKKCILNGIRCNHSVGMEGVVWQAEHLVERSNSATFAEPRLIVLVCRNCHGWKHFTKSNHDQYDEWVRSRISKDRVALWDRCRAEKWSYSSGKSYDWKLAEAALIQELSGLKDNQ